MQHSLPTLGPTYRTDLLQGLNGFGIANVTEANKLYDRGLITDHELSAVLQNLGAYVELEFCHDGNRAEPETGRCSECQPEMAEEPACDRCYHDMLVASGQHTCKR